MNDKNTLLMFIGFCTPNLKTQQLTAMIFVFVLLT